MRVKHRGRLSCACAAVIAGMLLGGQAPASGAPEVSYAGADDHYAGSQIARVEGIGALPDVLYGAEDRLLGHDVSSHQGAVDWGAASGAGARFAYVKATEGAGYVNPQFGQQYDGSYSAGIIRGAYHFALPDVSSGADQANFFIAHGGGWSADGRTLPGALDAEYNPYGETCYGKSPHDMVAWIHDFADTYHAKTGRFPTIYTSTSWWKRCTGNDGGFGDDPLWIARYNDHVGELPAGWSEQTIWQFADAGSLPGDQDWFYGGDDRLRAFALCSSTPLTQPC
jgi:GH25 family lysozyme M1 (1,4-beta-N-acetylmuramidase)